MGVLNHSVFGFVLARMTAWALAIAIVFAGTAGHTSANWSHSEGMQKVEITISLTSTDCAGHFGHKSISQDKQVACSPSMGCFIFDIARQEIRSATLRDANFVLPLASRPDSRNTVPPTPPPNSIMIA
jgi:hypothetical protein